MATVCFILERNLCGREIAFTSETDYHHSMLTTLTSFVFTRAQSLIAKLFTHKCSIDENYRYIIPYQHNPKVSKFNISEFDGNVLCVVQLWETGNLGKHGKYARSRTVSHKDIFFHDTVFFFNYIHSSKMFIVSKKI